jgi:hypothetical protein
MCGKCITALTFSEFQQEVGGKVLVKQRLKEHVGMLRGGGCHALRGGGIREEGRQATGGRWQRGRGQRVERELRGATAKCGLICAVF